MLKEYGYNIYIDFTKVKMMYIDYDKELCISFYDNSENIYFDPRRSEIIISKYNEYLESLSSKPECTCHFCQMVYTTPPLPHCI